MRRTSRPARGRKGTFVLITATALLALGVGAVVLADNSAKPAPASKEVTVPVAGVMVSVDPQTGQIRQPSPEEIKALTEGLQKQFGSPTPVKVVEYPNGMVSVELPDDYMQYTVLQVNPDGTRTVECVTGATAADALLNADGSAPAGDHSGCQDATQPADPNAGKE
jgi:hypothetical protein